MSDQPSCLILGDNIFFGHGLPKILQRCAEQTQGARIFAHPVRNPRRYSVVEFDESGRVLSLEEKPRQPRSHYAVPGIYFYDSQAVEITANLKPSPRGELEITDLNRVYLERGELSMEVLGRGYDAVAAGLREGTPALVVRGITRAKKDLIATCNSGRQGDAQPSLAMEALRGWWEGRNST